MLELFFLVTLQITYTTLIDRQNQFSIFSFLHLYSGFLANRVDPDQPASSEAGWSGFTVFAIQRMMCCIKGSYESDLFPHAKNSKWWQFLLAFWRKLLAFSKLASAKFDPWNEGCIHYCGTVWKYNTIKPWHGLLYVDNKTVPCHTACT